MYTSYTARASSVCAVSRASCASETSSWVPTPRVKRSEARVNASPASPAFCWRAAYVARARESSALAWAISSATRSRSWASCSSATRACACARSMLPLVRSPSNSGHEICTPSERSEKKPPFCRVVGRHPASGTPVIGSIGHGVTTVAPRRSGLPLSGNAW